VTQVNLFAGTTHNNAPINTSVKSAAMDLIKDGKYDEGILNKVEMMIRAHDPCLSCATHRLDRKLGVKIDLVDSKGNTLATLSN
jgi:F420-non-reducing hydrogenase large subunit